MLEICPTHEDYRSCIEDIIVSVATFWGRDYQLMFCESWDFIFKKDMLNENNLLGNLLHEGEDKTWRLLEEYHGIKLNLKDVAAWTDVFNIIKHELLSSKPTIIYTDSFWCPWSINYQKNYEQHPCLAIGMNETEDCIYCIDPYSTLDYKQLTINELRHVYSKCVTFDILDKEDKKYDWHDIIRKAALNIIGYSNNQGKILEMKSFADQFEYKFSLELEVENSTNFKSQLLDRLKYIMRRRKQFALVLEYLSCTHKVDELKSLSSLMRNASEMWEVILHLLLKLYYTGHSDALRCRIADKIRKVASYEEECAYQMLETVNIKINC